MLFLLPQCHLSHLAKLSPVKWIASNCCFDITKQNRPDQLIREGLEIEGSNLFIPQQRIKADNLSFLAWLGFIFCYRVFLSSLIPSLSTSISHTVETRYLCSLHRNTLFFCFVFFFYYQLESPQVFRLVELLLSNYLGYPSHKPFTTVALNFIVVLLLFCPILNYYLGANCFTGYLLWNCMNFFSFFYIFEI